MARCRWKVEGGVRFHIPECWGTVHDPDGVCNCPRAETTLEDRFEELAAQVARLTDLVATLSPNPPVNP